MTLRFVIGRAGAGKSRFCLDEIRGMLRDEPIGKPLIYLVPQQMSFQAESELAMTPGLHGMMRAQVLSFRRLAWKVLQEVGGLSRIHIDSTGIKMVLRKIIEKRKNDFLVFGRAATQAGFIDQLEDMYGEFKRYCISPEDLLEEHERLVKQAGNGNGAGFLADKLYDMHLVYEELENYLANRYLDAEHYLPLLAERISQSDYVRNATVWIDGFDGFTPQESAVVLAMLNHSNRVTITLTLDKPYEEARPDALDLFYSTAVTYQRLSEMARKHGIVVEEPVCLPASPLHSREYPPLRFADNPALEYLEANYSVRPAVPYPGKPDGLQVSSAANRRAEVEGAAQQILGLVRDRGMRFRDITVLTRSIEDYADILETVFADYQIPLFLDYKRSMLHHPLTELIRSALEVIRFGWRYDAVFRCIKTDLLLSPHSGESIQQLREDADQLENYVLAYGIEGFRWTDKQPWRYKTYRGLDEEAQSALRPPTEHEIKMEAKMNGLRDRIVAPLRSLQEQLQKAKSCRKMCEAIYRFLITLDVPRQLEAWSEEALSGEKLERAREHGQVWREIIGMLDQLVEMMGDEKVALDDFARMIETGMESLRFSLVPPSLDQVLAGSFDRTRAGNMPCIFILGANDGVMPARPKEDGVLAESERSFLIDSGMKLAPGSRHRLLEEEFMIYRAVTAPSRQLWVSYPLADEEGKALQPASLVKQIKGMFPHLQESFIAMEPGESADGEPLRFVSNPARTLSYLTVQLQQWSRGYPLDAHWWDVYNWLIGRAHHQTRRVLESLFYHNQEKNLQVPTSRKLYGEKLRASVSRMEAFKACPFSQFVSHGLRLKDRELYRLEAPDIGQLFHAALRMIGEQLRSENVSWGELTPDEIEKLSGEKVDELTPLLQREVLLSSNRNLYLAHKLKNVVGRAAGVLGEHARRSKFEPLALELAFGMDGTVPPLEIPLPNGLKMEIVGRIDRVDGAVGSNGLLLRIIDYKSSQTALHLPDVYFGLSLQVLTYLDVLITHAEILFGQKALPAGVLYFHVHNPLLQTLHPLSPEDVRREVARRFKMKGLLLADTEVVQLMDTTLEGGYSDILPVALKKDGGFYSSSSVATLEQFDLLRRYTRQMIQTIGSEIMDGVVAIHPYRKKKQTACTFCAYKPVCQFDQQFTDNGFNVLRAEQANKLWLQFSEVAGKERSDDQAGK
ncbi:helicase-exonuclease AddAB subunit AddB [Aneurinibacillus terranovensis]|uniref:helicase-exonuclease AddAB subunit AddB n=1 Tax=Aneurinibacillus terranovensis TaxID=278991 RepID=UPI0004819E0A|nr:helicase-exonuclease AddAB subunit AddB [Aneurinibacillus terranovensis]